jgi:hypothetical protein
MINLPSAQSMGIPSPANEGARRQACQDTSYYPLLILKFFHLTSLAMKTLSLKRKKRQHLECSVMDPE